MDISCELGQLTGPIEDAIAEFVAHADVNSFIETLKKRLTIFAEALVEAVIQPLFDNRDFLNHLKTVAAKKAYRFHGYRTELIKSPKNRKAALAKFKSYFMDNFHRMRYAGFRYFNATTGSGCVESAIRRVINLRLKSPGIFWKRETAELMLFLRSTLLCGRWNVMFRNLLADNRWQF